MEKYKKTLMKRIWLMAIIGIAITLMYLLDIPEKLRPIDNIHFSDYIKGFQAGMISVLDIMFVYLIVRYITTLKNEVKLKRLYNAEMDERQKFIREKTGGNVMWVCAVTIIIGAIIAAYFSETVFFTMLGCGVFLLLTKKFLSIYYNGKY